MKKVLKVLFGLLFVLRNKYRFHGAIVPWRCNRWLRQLIQIMVAGADQRSGEATQGILPIVVGAPWSATN